MDVLVVGAGAVGQSYGLFLSRGGARVSFYVRSARVESVCAGIDVHEVRLGRRATTERVTPERVVFIAEKFAETAWDQVWLAVPSPALRRAWLPPRVHANPAATVVVLQPGLDDRALVCGHAGEARVVGGLINLIAWYAPLPSEDLPPGVVVFRPRSTRCRSRDPPSARGVVEALRRGGARGRLVRDVAAQTAFGAASL